MSDPIGPRGPFLVGESTRPTGAGATAADVRLPPAPADEISIGLDTGGTFTDAVALDGRRNVLASAKAHTTHWDLAVGLGNALRAVLERLPDGISRHHVSLVSVSTTLATNAVVEDRFSPICALVLGFDEKMIERSGLKRMAGCVIVRADGGHDATGDQATALDEAAIDAAVAKHAADVEAFAVASIFSVRNPSHELRARERIRALSTKPVTCSHELSSKLDAPLRALTAALNARLTPPIQHLLEALAQVLRNEEIGAPLMVVKGDGTLMRAEVALEYPVETVLSGPAASVVGAGFLSGLDDFVVSDMGGTTTDVAIVIGGRPVVRAEGAVIAGWRTMVEAVDVHTSGLGGDSEVRIDRDRRLTVGPRKVMPLGLLATRFPEIVADLRASAAGERPPEFAAHYALRNSRRDAGPRLDRIEQRTWDALTATPRRVSDIARSSQAVEGLRRLVDRGLATLAAFTPSDALHVLGKQQGWNVEAARLGASFLATEERNASGGKQRSTPEEIAARTYEHVVRGSARALLESALAEDPGLEVRRQRSQALGTLIDAMVQGREFSRLLDARIRLATPLVAIGAPVGAYYPEVARRLGAKLLIPEHAAVCNAVGAVAGVVSEISEVLVNQPALQVFRVHDPAGSRDYSNELDAMEDARRVSRELAIAAARRAGAADAHVETTVIEQRANAGALDEYLAEATVRSRATGRPATGRCATTRPE